MYDILTNRLAMTGACVRLAEPPSRHLARNLVHSGLSDLAREGPLASLIRGRGLGPRSNRWEHRLPACVARAQAESLCSVVYRAIDAFSPLGPTGC